MNSDLSADGRGGSGPDVPVLSVRGVTKRWPRLPRPVLDDVDLELPRGSLTWIGGANGAGKTTLLRIVAGLVDAESGSVRVDGLDLDSDRRRYHAKIGLLPAASVGLYARLTVIQHLSYWAKVAFVPFEQRADAIADVMEAFGLTDLAKARVDRMSMGQRQRIRLALVFLPRPPLVLLDEPRNSLDSEGMEMLVDAVTRTTATGGSVVWCSPSGEEPGIDFDRHYVIADGRLEDRLPEEALS
jgi:ABC-type multidrug transport system ATPase subunit